MAPATRKKTEISRRSLLRLPLALSAPRTGAAAARERLELAGIPLLRIRNGVSTRRLLRIHGNEETAREAVELLIEEMPGEAWIVESKSRHVTLAGLRLDPNRMFSRAGAEKNLRLLNPGAAPETLAELLDRLDGERQRMLETLAPPAGGLWIAVHNNGPGYSMETEAPISRRIHRPEPGEPRDFLLFTGGRDYEIAARGPYNALLQDRPGGEDDGSLSRWCAARGVRYINVEAAHGRLDKQLAMLRWLVSAMP